MGSRATNMSGSAAIGYGVGFIAFVSFKSLLDNLESSCSMGDCIGPCEGKPPRYLLFELLLKNLTIS